jgi:hypothetical protein
MSRLKRVSIFTPASKRLKGYDDMEIAEAACMGTVAGRMKDREVLDQSHQGCQDLRATAMIYVNHLYHVSLSETISASARGSESCA